jgi:hypothetical protein
MIVDGDTLVGCGELWMWGGGCIVAPVTHFRFSPTPDGCRVDIEVNLAHTDGAPENEFRFTGALVLEGGRAAKLVRNLVAHARDARSERPPSGSTAIGVIRGELPLPSGPLAVHVVAPDQLERLSTALLTVVAHAGIRIDATLYPIPRAEWVPSSVWPENGPGSLL